MKNTFPRVALMLALLFSSIDVLADMHDKSGARITEVYINNAGVMLIQVEGVSGYLSIGEVGEKAAEVMYSTALAAKLSGQSNIWIRYWDVVNGYPSVGIISLK
ncbi:hypothetical protein [Microbulbifer rhizosphaerae]|uniref:Uncharacterized protein n=1 Tax=Microbulbifer rhizosphaerae TaxID=1562603 RepID=A0A7W4Z953_9GAMM|nr:hypothetical protein [Microbulbifer rhizosphaerae]MBB3059894.1 hypothetical protein [Microbulbifer rhizosphaerae]